MNKYYSKLNKGFTIVETLVAISVLMIAIVGPLTVASRGYLAALDAKYESVAINYSQEALEYLSYIKDNRLWGDWTSGVEFVDSVNPSFTNCIGSDNSCNFAAIGGLDQDISSMEPSSVFQSRKFYFSVQGINQILAVVETKWKIGNTEHMVTLNQILTNYER